MRDVHMHLERGPYTKVWVDEFVAYAKKRNIEEIYILEHTHRFSEFTPMYAGVRAFSPYQAEWLGSKTPFSILEYQKFIEEMRKHHFPVDIKWGLEVCYIPGTEAFVAERLANFNYDFITGSVHFIDNFAFDLSGEEWAGKDIAALYRRYYAIMLQLVESGLFSGLAHPDSIKCFGHLPPEDLSAQYNALAVALNKAGMYTEHSARLFNNYGYPTPGMNETLLAVLKSHGADIRLASDAHDPSDVGRNLHLLAPDL